jgi:hypothetical protein
MFAIKNFLSSSKGAKGFSFSSFCSRDAIFSHKVKNRKAEKWGLYNQSKKRPSKGGMTTSMNNCSWPLSTPLQNFVVLRTGDAHLAGAMRH